MNLKKLFLTYLLFIIIGGPVLGQKYKHITKKELKDKIAGYWIGQLAGNYIGFPFENLYDTVPIPVFINRYFNYLDADTLNLKMNLNDRRGFVNIMADAMGGAWSDDDTDIEFVMLHGLEKYGLDITYEEVAKLRKEHVNRFIWSSNKRVNELINQGYTPPQTGNKQLNEHWYKISSQLINEIWGVIYPGMANKAAHWAQWGAKITNDGWATHGTILYVSMYSAAFFEKDIHKLLAISMEKLPKNSPYLKGVKDVIKWHAQNKDWKKTRELIHKNYFSEIDGFKIPYPMGGAIINGLNGIMALLYGEGDFTKTVGIATTSGYDCDNQAATVGGLLGVINGSQSIPEKLTKELPSRGKWDKPFNDTYINYSRDNLPNYNKISEIVDRIAIMAEKAIIQSGGKKEIINEQIIYSIKTAK